MLNGKTFDLRTILSKNDAALYQGLSQYDSILDGCTISITSGAINIASGHFITFGRVTQVDGATTVNLETIPSTGYVRLKYVIDLTNAASDVEFTQGAFIYEYSTTTTFPALVQEDIQASGTTYEAEIAVCQIASGALSAITRTMPRIVGLNGKLNKAGGTMTGALTLSGAPTASLHPATKKYVDDADDKKLGSSGNQTLSAERFAIDGSANTFVAFLKSGASKFYVGNIGDQFKINAVQEKRLTGYCVIC